MRKTLISSPGDVLFNPPPALSNISTKYITECLGLYKCIWNGSVIYESAWLKPPKLPTDFWFYKTKQLQHSTANLLLLLNTSLWISEVKTRNKLPVLLHWSCFQKGVDRHYSPSMVSLLEVTVLPSKRGGCLPHWILPHWNVIPRSNNLFLLKGMCSSHLLLLQKVKGCIQTLLRCRLNLLPATDPSH